MKKIPNTITTLAIAMMLVFVLSSCSSHLTTYGYGDYGYDDYDYRYDPYGGYGYPGQYPPSRRVIHHPSPRGRHWGRRRPVIVDHRPTKVVYVYDNRTGRVIEKRVYEDHDDRRYDRYNPSGRYSSRREARTYTPDMSDPRNTVNRDRHTSTAVRPYGTTTRTNPWISSPSKRYNNSTSTVSRSKSTTVDTRSRTNTRWSSPTRQEKAPSRSTVTRQSTPTKATPTKTDTGTNNTTYKSNGGNTRARR